MRALVLALSLWASCASAQTAAPTETDLAAAYCLRSSLIEDRELGVLADCNNWPAPLRGGCEGLAAEERAHQARLRAYLAARGMLTSSEGARGIAIASRRADADRADCRAMSEIRCAHCLRLGVAEQADCQRRCSDQIDACARLHRCRSGAFLQGVP